MITRRTALKKIVAATAAISAPFIFTPSRAAAQRIVLRDPGGIYSKIYNEILYQPFTRETGIAVVSVQSDAEPTAQIRTMVETQSYLWDMMAISHRAVHFMTTGKVYLEKHGLEDDPIISSIPPHFRSAYGVGTNAYATVLAYRTDAFKGRQAPKSWQDFWDVENFPGRRSLRKLPFDTIEIALMADGVPAGSVYPCDLDRALRSLDKIKSQIPVWWGGGGTHAEHLLKTREIDLVPVFSIWAQSAIDAGAPVAISWEQHLYGCHNWAILKGTPNADACRKFIRFACQPERQALLAPYGIGPTHPGAFKPNRIDPNYAKRLPTHPDNLKKGLFIDASYWLKQDAIIQQFNHWLLS
ncbi:ABC transporter substrate-binding protein [Mycoavidus sp. SF9855]|uniref:ABC transporter substrate-binding protein n=1 Tax=Mycoavidus sp. SF9855 TaxID=2968475 RepID=UPI00211C9BFA|nr:ABC transporter substrate-binding protein [Mycoavidus sp. SF9855]UUM21287.1 ABC transporter substrate-binding protein [Mycoavidus sp. SF9855]